MKKFITILSLTIISGYVPAFTNAFAADEISPTTPPAENFEQISIMNEGNIDTTPFLKNAEKNIKDSLENRNFTPAGRSDISEMTKNEKRRAFTTMTGMTPEQYSSAQMEKLKVYHPELFDKTGKILPDKVKEYITKTLADMHAQKKFIEENPESSPSYADPRISDVQRQ